MAGLLYSIRGYVVVSGSAESAFTSLRHAGHRVEHLLARVHPPEVCGFRISIWMSPSNFGSVRFARDALSRWTALLRK